jgi:ABC-2 type transport system ATP-binding protein
METLLAIRGLRKRFGAIVAVDDVSFDVPRGQVLGFLGPNGAGKSTTMRMVAGYLPPTSGSVIVCGFDVEKSPIEVRRRLGYLPEGAPAYGEMTPAGILWFAAATRGMSAADRRRRTDEMVARLHLAPVFHQPIETLSKGFKRRVGLALALLHDPEILILDEPTDGLDPNQKHEVRTLLADLAPRKAIIISTHILEEVEALCSRALVIARGRLVADADPAELLGRSAYHNAVALRLAPEHADAARAALADLDGVARIDTVGDGRESAELIVLPARGRDILDAVRHRIDRAQLPVQQIHVDRGRLDDVFRDLTQAA